MNNNGFKSFTDYKQQLIEVVTVKGFTTQQIAEALNVTWPTARDKIEGKTDFTVEQLDKLHDLHKSNQNDLVWF